MVNPVFRGGGWHLMGTARMGEDPKRSVVDANCQAHDADNLHFGSFGVAPEPDAFAQRTFITKQLFCRRLIEHRDFGRLCVVLI